jgi:hypothetical protein
MRSLSKSIGRCAVAMCCLGISALAGCGNKQDPPKPASGEYYQGAMEKKPDQSPAGGGRMKVGAAPGTQ